MSGLTEAEKVLQDRIATRLSALPEIFHSFFRYLNETKSSATTYNYICDVAGFAEYIGSGAITETFYQNVTPEDISRYFFSIQYGSGVGSSTELSSSYLAAKWSALNSFFTYLEKEGHISHNPINETKRPVVTKKQDITYLTMDEVHKLLQNVQKISKPKFVNRDLLLLRLGFVTGLRVSSLINIDLDDLDLTNKSIQIYQDDDTYSNILLPDSVYQQLLLWLSDREKFFENLETKALFVSNVNQRMTRFGVSDLLKKYSAGIIKKNVTPDVMRNTCAMNLYKQTKDIHLCSTVLDHSDVATTVRFLRTSTASKQDAISMLDASIAGGNLGYVGTKKSRMIPKNDALNEDVIDDNDFDLLTTEVKNSMHSTLSLLDTIEKKGGKPERITEHIRDIFMADLRKILLYFASVDGKISKRECAFMNRVFELDYTAQQYARYIDANNMYSTEFEKEFPLSLQVLIDFDRKMKLYTEFMGTKVEATVTIVMKFIAQSGKAILFCDGITNDEVQEYQSYIDGLNKRISRRQEVRASADTDDSCAVVGKKINMISLQQPKTTKFVPGTYRVGIDIPAGEYKISPEQGDGYFSICTDASCEQIIRNGIIRGQAYLTICNGQFLKLSRCHAIPSLEAPPYQPKNGIYEEGEYKVGIEIAPRIYRITACNGAKGYYCVKYHTNDGQQKIVTNGNFSSTVYVQLERGQILSLRRCTLSIH